MPLHAAGDDRGRARPAVLSLPSCSASSRADEDVLDVGERVERVRAELAAEPGLLEAAERRRVAHRRVRVDRQVAGSTPRATRSARPTSRVQIEPDRPYSVSLAIAIASASSSNGSTATTGPNTSSRQTRSCVAPREHDGRRVPVARRRPARCRGTRRRPRRPRRTTPRVSRWRRADQRAHLGVVVAGRLDLDALAPRARAARGTGRRHVRSHQDPAARAAVLAGVVEDAVRRGRGRLLEVGVGEHDVRALAAELEGDPLHLVGGAAP